MALGALNSRLTHHILLLLLFLCRALSRNNLGCRPLSLSRTIPFTTVRTRIWLGLWILLVLHPAFVYVQNNLLLLVWNILRRGSWTSRCLNICPSRLHLNRRLYLNIWLLPFTLIWSLVYGKILVNVMRNIILLKNHLLLFKGGLRLCVAYIWIIQISVYVFIMIIRFVSWLDWVVWIWGVLLLFRLNTHHWIYFWNDLIVPLTILLRALNTFRDHITRVFSRISLWAKTTLFLLLLLFLSFGWLYDIDLLLECINLILQSNLLWLFMSLWWNILLIFVIAIFGRLLIKMLLLTFKDIFRTHIMRYLRIILGFLLWMATVDFAGRAVRWLVFGGVLGKCLIIVLAFLCQFAIPRLIFRCFRSLLGNQGNMIQEWINITGILLPQDVVWGFLGTLEHLFIDVCVFQILNLLNILLFPQIWATILVCWWLWARSSANARWSLHLNGMILLQIIGNSYFILIISLMTPVLSRLFWLLIIFHLMNIVF